MSGQQLSIHNSPSPLCTADALGGYGIVVDPGQASEALLRIPLPVRNVEPLEGVHPLGTAFSLRNINPDELFRAVLQIADNPPSLQLFKEANFHRHALPANRSSYDHGLPPPEPNFAYGYKPGAFEQISHSRAAAQESLYRIAELDKDLYWSFFVIHSINTAGAHLDSVINQCAFSAAVCLNAVQKLSHKLPSGDGSKAPAADSLPVFSLATAGHLAAINIQYVNKDTYYTAEIDRYDLTQADRVAALKAYIHPIIRWGLHERLASLRDALDELPPESEPDVRASDGAGQHVQSAPNNENQGRLSLMEVLGDVCTSPSTVGTGKCVSRWGKKWFNRLKPAKILSKQASTPTGRARASAGRASVPAEQANIPTGQARIPKGRASAPRRPVRATRGPARGPWGLAGRQFNTLRKFP